MAGIQIPPNSSGAVIDTHTTVGAKERQVVIANAAPPGNGTNWSKSHTPAAATQATVTQAAGAAGVKNIVRSIAFSLAVGAAAQTIIQVNLRDGTTGAGTILWRLSLLKASNEPMAIFSLSGLYIEGSTATAMTIEFSAGGVASSVQSVAMCGLTTA